MGIAKTVGMKTEPTHPENPDTLTNADDRHNLGLGLGIGSGALAGGLLGFAIGPLGAITGATLGAMTGAVTGLGLSKAINPNGRRSPQDEGMFPPELDTLPENDPD